jgi:hypothetical protein
MHGPVHGANRAVQISARFRAPERRMNNLRSGAAIAPTAAYPIKEGETMKRFTTNLMIAAAAIAAVAGSASAQTLKADIPFTFHAGTGVMSPGTYDLRMNHTSASSILVLQNRETGKSAMVAQFTASDAPKEWRANRAARLAFECAGSRCVLRSVWQGGDASAYNLRGPKFGPNEEVHTAEIRMTSVKAD